MSVELLIKVRLDWSAPGHYDPGAALPCESCDQPTKMRDSRGRPYHQSCAEQAMAEELLGRGRELLADERFGYSDAELAEELAGTRRDADRGEASGERVPTPARRVAVTSGGAR